MAKKLLSALIASLFTAAPAFGQSADDPMRVQGTGTLGGIYNNTNARDNAQIDLYQDLGNGVMSNVGVQGRNSTTWFQGYGENFGRPTSTCSCVAACTTCSSPACTSTTSRGTFSTSAFTPFNGSGGNLLTATFPLTGITAIPPTGWNGFTLGYDRRDWGGYAEWQRNSPWYFRVDGNEVKFSGTRPGSGSNGTSPGNGYTDLAFPQDFKTTNWGVEGGYQSGKATFGAALGLQQVRELERDPALDQSVLCRTTPTTTNLLDTTYLAPANTFNKFTASGNYRDLPWQSVISARYTYAKTTSDTPIALTALNTDGVFGNTLPDDAQLQRRARQPVVPAGVDRDAGRELEHARLLLLDEAREQVGRWSSSATHRRSRSHPASAAETSSWPVFRRRRSATAIPELYNYTKNNVGFDAWWKFARGQRLGFGYDYLNIDQTRVDYDKSHTNKLWVEYKNTMFDTVSGRLKYQYLKRDSDLNFTNDPLPNGGANNPNFLLPFTSAFDLQSSTTNQVKLISTGTR